MTRQSKAAKYRELMETAMAYVTEEKPTVSDPESVYKLMLPITQGVLQESFFVLILDAKNHVLEIHHSVTGLLDRTMIHPREVFRQAIVLNASRVILAHNHPSGDPTPSTQDIAATRQLVEAGKIIGIEVLDHIVMGQKTTAGGRTHVSFRQENML